jgi:N-carbamoylputrescine amidase
MTPRTPDDDTLTLAVLQTALTDDEDANVARVTQLVREAAARGADVVLPPELFAGHYFCREERDAHFARARPADQSPLVARVAALAAELRVTIPVSFFERAGPCHYNSVAVAAPDGRVLGVYRKSHIPAGSGYQEKYYFRPGDTGFRVWPAARGACVGVGICWDQWFPECARAMVLMGADVLLYPTAIGSEPHDATLDTRDPWQRAMIGHAVCNIAPVAAANRTGTEGGQTFYGSSFLCDHLGNKVAELGRADEGVLVATFDLARVRRDRAAFGFFRDRRPELYGALVEAQPGREVHDMPT